MTTFHELDHRLGRHTQTVVECPTCVPVRTPNPVPPLSYYEWPQRTERIYASTHVGEMGLFGEHSGPQIEDTVRRVLMQKLEATAKAEGMTIVDGTLQLERRDGEGFGSVTFTMMAEAVRTHG